MGWDPSSKKFEGGLFFESFRKYLCSRIMGRILAIDYGRKRSGMAITDTLQISINPLPTMPTHLLEAACLEKLNQGDVDILLFGLPTHTDGTETYLKADIDGFIKKLKKTFQKELQIEFIDESFSSVEARNVLLQSGIGKKKRREKGRIDQMSAVLLIRRYLNY